MKAKNIIGTTIIVSFAVWGASAFWNTTVQYVSIEQARTANKMVQVMGKIDFDRVKYNTEESHLEFFVYDADATDPATASQMKVIFTGVVPGNFDQATSVVLKGRHRGDAFVAEKMLVKCPSKYQGEGGQEYQDYKKHEEAAETSEA